MVLTHILILDVMISRYIIEIFSTDTYGQGSTYSFKFDLDDILELQWLGPKKRFTIQKVNSEEK